MPYEFLAKNGLISQGNTTVTGSLVTTQNITGSNITASGTGSFGRVGIGTNSASTNLDIVTSGGTADVNAIRIFRNTDTLNDGISIKFDTNTRTSAIRHIQPGGGVGTLCFDVQGSEKVRIDGSGNVGIGTTVPTGSLHVYQAIGVGETAIATIQEGAGGAAELVFRSGNASTNRRGALRFYSNQISTTTAQWTIGASMDQTSGDNSFYFYNASSTSILTLSQTNVGIGVNPVAKLQVAGNISGSSFTSSVSNAVGFLGTSSWAQTANSLNTGNSYIIAGLTNNGTLSQQGTLSMGSGYQILATTGTAPSPGIAFVGDTNTGIYSPGADTIGFSISGSESSRIDSSGNLLISTTTSPSHAGISLGSTGTVRQLLGGMQNTSWRIRERDQIDALAITTNINDSGTQDSAARSSWKLRMGWGNGQDNFLISRSPAASSTFSDLFLVKSDGSVGIGTTTPTAKLNIASTSQTTKAIIQSVSAATGLGGYLAFNPGGDSTYSKVAIGVYDNYYSSFNRGNIAFMINSVADATEVGFTDTKMYISASGYVGVGTTSPATFLDVVGSNGSFPATSGATQSTGSIVRLRNGNSNLVLDIGGNLGTGGNWLQSTNRNNLSLNYALLLNPNGGNIGIGTTNPTSSLHIKPTAIGADLLILERYASQAKLVYAYEYAADGYLEVRNGSDVAVSKLSGYATTPSYFLSNVGVGTSTPNNRLHVYNSAGSSTTASNAIAVFEQNSNAGIQVCVPDASEAGLFFSRNGAAYYSAVTRNGTDLLLKNGSATAVTINSSRNVGIGTTTPIGRLEVNGGSLATTSGSSIIVGSFSSGVSNSSYLNIIETRFATGSDWQTARTRIQKTIDVTNQAYIDFNPSGSLYGLAFGTGVASEKMRIDSNGNVGIGTSVPTQKLEVQGNGLFGNDSVTNVGLRLTRLSGGYRTSEHIYHSSQNSPWYTYGQHLTWTGELSGIVEPSQNYRPYFEGFSPAGGYKVFGFMGVNTGSFTSADAINALTIKNDGNIGIGTTNPATKLHLSGTGSTELRITSTTSNINSLISFYELALASWGIDAGQANGSFFIKDLYNTRTVLTLNSSGNVGIGTTGPSYKLDVSGSAIRSFVSSGSAEPGFIVDYPSSNGYGAFFVHVNGTRRWRIGSVGDLNAEPSLNFWQEGTGSRMIIGSNGYVGIGTSVPAGNLDVYSSAGSSHYVRSSVSAMRFLAYGDGTNWIQSGTSTSNSSADLIFSSMNGVTQWMRIQGSTGNVGIGTASPSSILHTAGAGDQVVRFTHTDNVVGRTLTIRLTNNNATYLNSGTYIQSIQGAGIDYYSMAFGTTNNSTTSTERMRIDSNGNVGIGTTNPSTGLYLSGSYLTVDRVEDVLNARNIMTMRVGGTAYWTMGLDVSRNLVFSDSLDTSSPKITILRTSGNVGIGTTTPGAKLEITGSSNSALLNIKSPISGAILYVSGSGAVGIGTSAVGAYTLQVSGSFGATTKSFIIEHPTKEGKKLVYGSLESPYHGIRLTGRDTLIDGKCKVQLPDYIYKLILHDSVNIQLTGIKCNKVLYIDEINVPENYFTIAYDKAVFETYKDYDFFWDFTAIRADVPELETEI